MKNSEGIHVTLQWDSPEDDVVAMGLVHKMGQDILTAAERHETSLAYRFMNDAYEGQNVL